MAEMPDRDYTVDSEQLQRGWVEVPAALERLGFEDLREGQRPVVANILAGVDTICVLPTGGGKTATFVIPALALDWGVIVFSPLLALIRDQVQSLQKKRIPAMAMTSMQSASENKLAAEKWANGELSFLYVAPERLKNPVFRQAMTRRPADLCVVDEAHCISQWSDNFRSAYADVGRDYIAHFSPKVVMCCTATCPSEVEDDIRRVVGIPNAKKLIYYPRRSNLDLRSASYENDQQIGNLLRDEIDGPAIVYCSTVARTEEMAATLGRYLKEDVIHFHGQLNDSDKKHNMDAFMSDRIRIVCATNAFGMGVDKPNIRGVIHRDIPGSIEALAQETGRAGRDGNDSLCMTYLAKDSLNTQKFFIETANPSMGDITRVFTALKNASDTSGYVEITTKQLGMKTGVAQRTISTIFEILQSSGVVERKSDPKRNFRVRPVYPLEEDARFQQYWDFMETNGIKDADGFYTVDIDGLVEHVGVSDQTVRNWLKKWHSSDKLRYIPPFSGTPTQIIGNLNDIDFDRVETKAKEAVEKLAKVLEYCNLPDNEKHDFLETYFEID